MSDNFRQAIRLTPAVAKVLVEYEKLYSKAAALEQWNYLVEAILVAHDTELERIAKEMPKPVHDTEDRYVKREIARKGVNHE